jgi:CBS domain-containing protein
MIMLDKKIGCVLIEHSGQLIGIITETDIVRKAVGQDMDLTKTLASKIMNAPVLAIDSEASVLEANDMMDKHHIRHLAVTEEGNFVGVISVRDLLHPVLLDEEPY